MTGITASPKEQLISPPTQGKANEPSKHKEPKKSLPLSQLLNRVILFGTGAGLLAWGLTLTATRVTSVTATKAFVNGKIITVTSPLSGQVEEKANLDSGMPITNQQLLLKVNEPLSNSQWVQNLKLDLVTEKAKLESIEAKIRQVAKFEEVAQPKQNQKLTNQTSLEVETPKAQEVAFSQLETETERTKTDAAIRVAEQNVKEAEVDLRVAQDHEQVAKSKYAKFRVLSQQGAVSTFSVDELLKNWRVSQDQVEAARVKLETTKIHLVKEQKLKEQQEKFYKLKSRSPLPSQNRLSLNQKIEPSLNEKTESLNPEFTELQRQKTTLEIDIEAKEKALAEAQNPIEQKNYPILASSKGVLWEVMVHNGEQVNSGQPLLKQLDCQQLWVDAFVNIDDLKRFEIDSPAQVEIYGKNLKLDGRVKTIRSPLSGEQKLGQDVAVNPPDLKNQQLAQVRIELQNPKELINSHQSSAQFCQVGQVAKVNIGQGKSFLANLPF
jgi:multidrug resistance efflux pump